MCISRYFQHMCNSGGVEHSLSISADAFDVSMGEESLHPPPPQAPHHEETHQDAQQGVGDYFMMMYLTIFLNMKSPSFPIDHHNE